MTPPQARRRVARSFAVVLAALGLPAAASAEPAPAAPLPVAVTISGGISLGAYEAGLNWALIRFLRAHSEAPVPGVKPLDLTIATGASAGNINTLLSSAAWCDQKLEPAWDNRFRLWLEPGLQDLVPKDPRDYQRSDGLLARRKLDYLFDQLNQQVSKGTFRKDCAVSVGVTVTSAEPERLEFGNIEVQSSRSSVLWDAYTKDSRLLFRQHYRRKDPPAPDPAFGLYDGAIGQQVFLQSLPDGHLDGAEIMEVVKASSAVQAAFGLVGVWTCDEPLGPKYSPDDSRCSNVSAVMGTPSRPRRRFFSDGGFFDNTPVGLAFALGWEREQEQRPAPQEFIYFDPDERRGQPRRRPVDAEALGHGELRNLLRLIGGLVSSARGYELATVRRYWKHRAADIHASSRHHALAGQRLANFGAFFSRAFREHDYLVGIYDGARFVTDRICTRGGWGEDPPKPECQGAMFEAVLKALGFGAARGQREAMEVEAAVRFLKWEEDRGSGPRGDLMPAAQSPAEVNRQAANVLLDGLCTLNGAKDCTTLEAGKAALPWPELPVFAAVFQGARVAEHGGAPAASDWVAAALEREGLGHLLRSLGTALPGCAKSPVECPGGWNASECEATCKWVKSPGEETRALLDRLLARQQVIERSGGGSAGLFTLMRGALRQEEMLSIGTDRLNGGSASPSVGWAFVPYHLSSEAFRSGIVSGYRIDSSRSWLSWNVGLTPLWVRAPALRDSSWFAAADTGFAVKTRWPWISAFDVNAAGRVRLDARAWDVGAAATAYLFLNKVRIGALWFPTSANEVDITLGISDLAGLLSLALE